MRVSHFGSCVFATLIVTFVAGAVHAAPIFYPDSPTIPPGVTFTDIFESSVTDPVPLYGPPSYFTTGMDFDPAAFGAFSASTSGGGGDVTDGQLNFTVNGAVVDTGMVGIDQISLSEAGDYSLLGLGTPATHVTAGASLRVTVTEIDGESVTPIHLGPSNASVSFNVVANPGMLQPWSLGMSLNIEAQLTAMGIPHQVGATEVEVVINDQLAALSEPSSIAFIAKKEFIIGVVTDVEGVIPEPATLSLLALGTVGALMRRRRGA